MRLVLVDNLLLPDRGTVNGLDVHPHLGLLSLAAVASAGGHQAPIWDPKLALTRRHIEYGPDMHRQAAFALLDLAPDAVGFTAFGCSFLFALRTAVHLKRQATALPILLGGPHASILDRAVIERCPEFDAVVRHEAEETLLPVLAALPAGDFSGIPGVTWRREGEVVVNPGMPSIADLDTLPFGAYEQYPIEELGLSHLRLDAGRGCPFECTFCSTASFFGRSYRLKSPARLVGELDHLHRRYGFSDFRLNHDLFTVNKEKVRAFCREVRDRGYTWGVSARVDCVDQALIGEMWEAGCRRMYFGIETGSERMQKVSKKRLDLDLLEPTLDRTGQLGMQSVVSYITGYPEEVQDDLDLTLDAIGRCFSRDEGSLETMIFMLSPEPGTRLHEEYGDRLGFDAYINAFNASRLDAEDERRIRADPELFVTYYHYPTRLPRERLKLVVDAYRALRQCGHDVLRYALFHHRGRFSQLVGAFCDWVESTGRTTPIEAGDVIGYFRDTFGAEHHLTSLVIFTQVVDPCGRIRPPRPGHRPPQGFAPDRVYRFGPEVFLFPRLHDVPALVSEVRRAERPLEDQAAGPLGCRLAVGRRFEGGAVHWFSLAPEEQVVATLFRSPRSWQGLCEVLGLSEDLEEAHLVRRLVEAEALVPADAG